MPKKAINIEGVIQRITNYQVWIADGKLGDERNRLNPILNEAREALNRLKDSQRRIKSLQTRNTNLEKMRQDHIGQIKNLRDQLAKKRG